MNYQKRRYTWVWYLALFLAGVLLLFLRNPDPIRNPIVYTEDGLWTAMGLRDGWINTFLHSREDYFVFSITLLLYISSTITTLTGGGSIENLPYAIAFISYSFYSAFALLIFSTIKRVSSITFAAAGFLLALLIPLGITQNEIIGRILQVGFLMLPLAMMLLFWRDRCKNIFTRRAIDLAIFISAGSNPVVFVLAFIYFSYILFLNKFNLITTLRKNALLISLLTPLAIALLLRPGNHGGVPVGFDPNNLIEAVTARSILFPLIFPWYEKLSNALSIAIFLAFALITFTAIKFSTNLEAKRLTYAVIATTVIYTFLAMVMRSGLTILLHKYQTSSPDRYFMGINVLVSMLVVLIIAQLINNTRTRALGTIISIFVVFVYVHGYSKIFEFKESKMPIHGYLLFKDQICLSEKISNEYKIQILPAPPDGQWVMLLPEKYINKNDCGTYSYEDLGLARPGSEYKMIYTPALEKNKDIPLNFYDFPTRKPVSSIEIMLGTNLKSNPGTAQLVLKNVDGKYEKISFSLTDLQDNSYRAFDVPEGIYVSGKISALTGQGVSVLESHAKDGKTLSCIKFRFTDENIGFTPGCPNSR